MPRCLLIQDACVLINLLATGRFEDIARGTGFDMAISGAAARETIYLRVAGSDEKEPVSIQPFVDGGLLTILGADSEEERRRFVRYAAELDDGEAMSLALADCRGLPLATDDRKALRLIADAEIAVEVWSTVRILKQWQAGTGISRQEMRPVLGAIRDRARFHPAPGGQDRAWWDLILA